MKLEDVKTWLKEYKIIEMEHDSLIDEHKKWCERSCKVTSNISGMPKGKSGENTLQKAVDMMTDIEEQINDSIVELNDKRVAVLSAIDHIKDPHQRMVLKYRYIDGLLFDEIAKKMSYTVENIFYIHRKALKQLVQ